jgi:hypothetical protein
MLATAPGTLLREHLADGNVLSGDDRAIRRSAVAECGRLFEEVQWPIVSSSWRCRVDRSGIAHVLRDTGIPQQCYSTVHEDVSAQNPLNEC